MSNLARGFGSDRGPLYPCRAGNVAIALTAASVERGPPLQRDGAREQGSAVPLVQLPQGLRHHPDRTAVQLKLFFVPCSRLSHSAVVRAGTSVLSSCVAVSMSAAAYPRTGCGESKSVPKKFLLEYIAKTAARHSNWCASTDL